MRCFLSIFLLFFSLDVFSGIALSQAVIHFEANGKRSEDIEVLNQGDETLYIRVEPSIINNPGTDEQQREVYRDPKAAGLLVTPQRLVIAPGARKRLRFVRLDDPKKAVSDKVYRVLVKPEVGEVKAKQTALKIIVAYEVLVISQPEDAKHHFEYSFIDNKLSVTNTGNSNVLLQKGIQCPRGESIEDEKNNCKEINGKRLYPGNTWETELPLTTPVRYQYSVGMNNDVVTFSPVVEDKQ